MGTAIVAKNTNAEMSGMRKFIPPVTRNLEAWHFLNTNVAKAATNYAMGKPDAVVVGAPVELPEYIQFKALANYLQTEVVETATQTTFSVIRTKDTLVDDGHRPAFYGNFGTFADGGSYLAVSSVAGGVLVKAAVRFLDEAHTSATSAQASIPLASINLGEWTLVVDRTEASANVVQDVTNGVEGRISSASGWFGRNMSAAPLRVGSMYPTSIAWGGTADMALWAHYSTELTDSEVAAIVATIRAYMLQRFNIAV